MDTNTTTGHTQGPWKVMDGTDETGQHKYVQCPAGHGPGVQGWGMVAKTCGIQPLEEKEANAALIAAAPDLLEALKDVERAYQELFDVMPVAWQTIDHIVSAAIAKAKGA